MSKVLAVGSVNADLTIQAPRFPKPGETISGSGFTIGCGGKGGNQAAALRRLGCDVTFLGAVGRDEHGKRLKDNLSSFGVDTSKMKEGGAPTGVAVITVCQGENTIILDEGANALVDPAYLASCEACFEDADFLVMQYEIPKESVRCAARLARLHGVKVVVNPSPYREDEETIGLTDLLVVNEHEAAQMTGVEIPEGHGTEEARKALRVLREKVPSAVITLGSAGCVYSFGRDFSQDPRDAEGSFPAYPVKVVDTTCAGDSFLGALIAALGEGQKAKEAVRFATAASALSVQKAGATASIPSRQEVERFLRS